MITTRLVEAAACARAWRSSSEVRIGAATAAPPRPLRTIRRLIKLFIFRNSSGGKSHRYAANASLERIRLGEIPEQAEDGVAVTGNLGLEGVDRALVVSVRLATGGER